VRPAPPEYPADDGSRRNSAGGLRPVTAHGVTARAECTP
jgi:hypothetical protein